jgi:hypothetical protein
MRVEVNLQVSNNDFGAILIRIIIYAK